MMKKTVGPIRSTLFSRVNRILKKKVMQHFNNAHIRMNMDFLHISLSASTVFMGAVMSLGRLSGHADLSEPLLIAYEKCMKVSDS